MSSIGPAGDGQAITPDDNTDLQRTTRGIWVGAAGNVHVTLYSGSEVTLKAVPAGTMLPIGARKVWATGTSAADLVGLW